MTQPQLPPRGIFVPTQLIFHPELPSVVLVTWIQLRCLAWASWATPAMNISELAAHIGIHPSRLHKHLAQLQDISALSWHTAGHGKLIISFPEEPTTKLESQTDTRMNWPSTNHNCVDREIPVSSSYFPQRIMGYLTFDDDEEETLNADGMRVEPTGDLSKLTICTPKEHAFLAK